MYWDKHPVSWVYVCDTCSIASIKYIVTEPATLNGSGQPLYYHQWNKKLRTVAHYYALWNTLLITCTCFVLWFFSACIHFQGQKTFFRQHIFPTLGKDHKFIESFAEHSPCLSPSRRFPFFFTRFYHPCVLSSPPTDFEKRRERGGRENRKEGGLFYFSSSYGESRVLLWSGETCTKKPGVKSGRVYQHTSTRSVSWYLLLFGRAGI